MRMGFNVWRSTRRMKRRSSFHESYWYMNVNFSYDFLAISLLWSHQCQSVFLSSLWFRMRCLILTSRESQVQASYSMWLAAWDILWWQQKTVFLQSRYWCSQCTLTIIDAISPFRPSTSVWLAQSYLISKQFLYYIAGLKQLFSEFKDPQTAYELYHSWSWAGKCELHGKVNYWKGSFR